MLIDYGHGSFDLNHRCRTTALVKALREGTGDITFSSGLIGTVGCGNGMSDLVVGESFDADLWTALTLYYDGLKIPRQKLLDYLCGLEEKLGDLSEAKVRSRRFRLPLTFESKKQEEAIQRYIETQRPYASYLPDNVAFLAKNNAFSKKEVEKIFLTSNLMVISVGFFTALPLALPVDPRHRMNSPKMNPSRVYTPAGSVSWGGSCMAYVMLRSHSVILTRQKLTRVI